MKAGKHMTQKQGRFVSRTKARKRAVEVIFEADQKGITRSPAAMLSLLDQRRIVGHAATPLPAYAVKVVEGLANNMPAVDALLERHVKDRTLDRLPAADRAVLRVGAWEMLFNEGEVPKITAIDEAVAIVKQLSTDDSPAYVNAVLDAARQDLAAQRSRQVDEQDVQVDSDLHGSAGVEVSQQISDEDLDDLLDEY